jgi:hypothetical protein
MIDDATNLSIVQVGFSLAFGSFFRSAELLRLLRESLGLARWMLR